MKSLHRLPGGTPRNHVASHLSSDVLCANPVLIAVAALAALLLLFDGVALYHALKGNPTWRTSTDFGVYLHSAAAIIHGGDPYGYKVYDGPPGVYDSYAYPPALAELLAPLTLLGATAARYVWIAANVCCLAASLALLLRGFGARAPWPWVGLAFAVVLFGYTGRNDLYHGQANFPLLLLLSLGLWAYLKGRMTLSGVLWGMMVVVKPFLGVLLIYLLWRRFWRAAGAGIATSAVLLALSFVPTLGHGLSIVGSWLRASRYDASPVFLTRLTNLSLDGVILRLFAHNPYTQPWVVSAAAVRVSSLLLLGLLLALFVLAVPRGGAAARDTAALLLVEVGVVLGLTMSYGPLTENDHLYVLLPALAGAALMARRHTVTPGGAWAWWAATAVWAVIFALRANPVRLSPVSFLGSHYHDYGAALLWTGVSGYTVPAAVGLTSVALCRTRGAAL